VKIGSWASVRRFPDSIDRVIGLETKLIEGLRKKKKKKKMKKKKKKKKTSMGQVRRQSINPYKQKFNAVSFLC
jgi:hypothetical protein